MLIEPGASFWEGMGVVIPICLLSLIALRLRVLDTKGTFLAAIAGILIGIFGGPSWLVILLFFLITSYLATRFKYECKQRRGIAEGNGGTRRTSNVFYNGLVPTLIAVFSAGIGEGAAWLYITAIAAAASDTFASEIGVLSNRVYMITNPARNSMTSNPAMRIYPGVDGGVSALGTVAAFTASFVISLLGWILIPWAIGIPRTLPMLILPAVLGFVGCNIDSLLGATLESRKLINKGQVNLTAIIISTLLMVPFI